MFARARQNSNADIISGDIRYVHKDGKAVRFPADLRYGQDKISVFRSLLTQEYPANLVGKIFKKDLFLNFDYCSYEKATNGEDAAIFYQVVDNSEWIIHIHSYVYTYFQISGSSTNKSMSKDMLRSILIANKIIIDICSKYPDLAAVLFKKVSYSLNNLRRVAGKERRFLLCEIENMHLGGFVRPLCMLKYFSLVELGCVYIRYFKRTIGDVLNSSQKK